MLREKCVGREGDQIPHSPNFPTSLRCQVRQFLQNSIQNLVTPSSAVDGVLNHLCVKTKIKMNLKTVNVGKTTYLSLNVFFQPIEAAL